MSDIKDFVIEDGVLKEYTGNGGDVVIPEGVTSIGEKAFIDCLSLTSVTIPEGVTSIGPLAFFDCSGLRCVVIPGSVTSIGYSAFNGCSSLTSMTIPKGVTIIESGTFNSCSSLTSMTIPEGVTSIGDYAFFDCRNITSLSIPKSVKKFGTHVFSELLCSEVPARERKKKAIQIVDAKIKGEQIFDVIYESYLKYILAHKKEWFDEPCGNARLVIQLLMREKRIKITEIDGLIERVSQLNDPELLNQLMAYQTENFQFEDYEHQADKEFRKIEKEAELRADVTSHKYINAMWTFGRKEPLVKSFKDTGKVVTFPEQIKNTIITGIADKFEFKSDMEKPRETVEEVVIPEGYTCIGVEAFRGCINLKRITIPTSMMHIGNYAFSGCNNIKEIYYRGDLRSWIATNRSDWNDSPMRLGAMLYCDGDLVKGDLVIPEGVTSIEDGTFWACNSLTSVIIPEGVVSIGEAAFGCCGVLTSVTIPESVTSIGNGAFYGCSALTNVTIPKGITSIRYRTYCGCSSLNSVTIPNSVTIIEKEAFYHCEKLSNATIPTELKSIMDSAFEGCKNLRSMELPKSVSTIGFRAFAESGIKVLIVRSESLSLKDTRCMTGCRNYVIYAPKGSRASQYIPDRTLPLESLDELTSTDSTSAQKVAGDSLSGLTFVVTGDLASYPDRADLKTFIESSGGRLTGSISGKTDYLIANDQSSGTTKLQKARQLGVKIIDEEAFLKMAGLK